MPMSTTHPNSGHGFNPRPAPRSGAISCGVANVTCWAEFQSAPRSEERGDGGAKPQESFIVAFQSAPRSEERGDEKPIAERLEKRRFQSAPRSEERGD